MKTEFLNFLCDSLGCLSVSPFLPIKTSLHTEITVDEIRSEETFEHPLGVIREQEEWPLRPEGARSMALKKEWSRE